jgi:Protein of unknown function (DUF3237)
MHLLSGLRDRNEKRVSELWRSVGAAARVTAEGGNRMNLSPLCEMEMDYTWTDFVDYGVGGQYVGTLEGTVKGDRLRGTLKSVNVPAKRPDNVNCPAFRGIIVTDDGAKIYFEFNGIALLRPEDKARIFTTSLSLRTGDARYSWLNEVVGVVEGILNTTTDQAIVRAFTCQNELATVPA